jgi:hypothetical protein
MSSYTPDPNLYVAYHVFNDDDKALFVKPYDHLTKSDVGIFKGTLKECRRHVIENQKKADTPGLKKFLVPPEHCNPCYLDYLEPLGTDDSR